MNQRQLVLNHLKKKGTITTFQAYDLYGVTRLSSVIYDLKEVVDIDGYMETGINRYGQPVSYKVYFIKKSKRNDLYTARNDNKRRHK